MPDDPLPTHATHDIIMAELRSNKDETDARLGRGEVRFTEIIFTEIIEAIKEIKAAVAHIPSIQTEIVGIKEEVQATKEIVEAWSAVKTMGKFIKWFSGIVAAAGVIFASFKLGGVPMFKD